MDSVIESPMMTFPAKTCRISTSLNRVDPEPSEASEPEEMPLSVSEPEAVFLSVKCLNFPEPEGGLHFLYRQNHSHFRGCIKKSLHRRV